jgi:hypothetical protein
LAFLTFIKESAQKLERADQLARIIENFPSKKKNIDEENGELQAYLYFVGPFSGNPSSVFGHIFIVFDYGLPGPLAEAYGYSALVQNPGFFSYIYKGLTGGYPGVVSKEELYKFWRKYASLEDREIYLFRINSQKTSIQKLRKSLENPEKFSRLYYFRHDNCATFIRRLFYGLDAPTPFEEYPYAIVQKLVSEQYLDLVEYHPTRTQVFDTFQENTFEYKNALYDSSVSNLERLPRLREKALQLSKVKGEREKADLNTVEKVFKETHAPHRMSAWFGNDDRLGISYRHFFQGLNDPKTFAGYHDFLEFAEIQIENFESFYLKRLKLLDLTTNKTFSLQSKKLSSRFDLVYDHYRYASFESRRARFRTGFGIFENYNFLQFGVFVGPTIGSCDSEFCAPILSSLFFKLGDRLPMTLTGKVDWESEPWKDKTRSLFNVELGINLHFNQSTLVNLHYQKTFFERDSLQEDEGQFLGQIFSYF